MFKNMNQNEFKIKKFVTNIIIVICVSYLFTVIIFGIIWDPNGAILLERPLIDSARIIWIGFYSCIPLAIGSFIVNHPMPATMGLGYVAFCIVGLYGIKNATGQQILYVLMAFLTVFGTVKFFLIA